MSHVGSLNCSKEEGLLKLNLASKTLKFSGTNLLPPAVVVAEIPLAIHYLFLIKKSFFQHFSFQLKIDSLKKIVKSLIR